MLLEGDKPLATPLPPGSPLRIGLPGSPHLLPGRLAAYGEDDRFLVALGSRAVRGAARVRADLRAVVQRARSDAGLPVRIVDLSSSGARLRGLAFVVGADFDLRFIPPGRTDQVTLHCVVV